MYLIGKLKSECNEHGQTTPYPYGTLPASSVSTKNIAINSKITDHLFVTRSDSVTVDSPRTQGTVTSVFMNLYIYRHIKCKRFNLVRRNGNDQIKPMIRMGTTDTALQPSHEKSHFRFTRYHLANRTNGSGGGAVRTVPVRDQALLYSLFGNSTVRTPSLHNIIIFKRRG